MPRLFAFVAVLAVLIPCGTAAGKPTYPKAYSLSLTTTMTVDGVTATYTARADKVRMISPGHVGAGRLTGSGTWFDDGSSAVWDDEEQVCKREEGFRGPVAQPTKGNVYLESALSGDPHRRQPKRGQLGVSLYGGEWTVGETPMISAQGGTWRGGLTIDECRSIRATVTLTPLCTVHGSAQRVLRAPDVCQELRAEPGDGYTVTRGGTVTLDGSASTPRRSITSYRWTFSRVRCPARLSDGGAPLHLHSGAQRSSARTTITVLCSLTAWLTVSDGQETARRKVHIDVQPRRFPAVTRSEPERDRAVMPFPPTSVKLNLGRNRCALEWHASADVNTATHWLHPGVRDPAAKQFDVAQIADPGGPFDGAWYVTGHHLAFARTEIVNSRLLWGGDVYALNRDHDNLDDLRTLVESVRDHEEAHTTLADVALDTAAGDPVPELEGTVGPTQEITSYHAELAVSRAADVLQERSSEARVHRVLEHRWGNVSVSVWIMSPSGTPYLSPFRSLGSAGDGG